jgi:hypothetical protein
MTVSLDTRYGVIRIPPEPNQIGAIFTPEVRATVSSICESASKV